jgi:glycosyltransferase involved in cell wall biosynthesis/SAM-dependent methyltransferase/uncharacterized coiled-coil protein SlyX
MKTFQELYKDHQGKVTDKWSLYLTEYDRLLSPLRRRKDMSLLEIGTQNGGSLEIFAKYFSKARKLIGCDNDLNCAKLSFEDSRIALVIGDINTDDSESEILKYESEFDLIIDDGSHRSGDIVKSFARYFKYLKYEGLFVVEDLHCSYWQDFEGGLYYPFSSLSFFKRLADILNYEHWGIDKERKTLIEGFAGHFNIEFDESSLTEIHSIEFLNSICVIRKKDVDSNILKTRVIAGSKEEVKPVIHLGDGSPYIALPQKENNWSLMEKAPEEEWQSLKSAISDLSGRISVLNDALSQRDEKITQLSDVLSERDGRICELNGGLTERESRIEELSGALSDVNGQITGLKQAVIEREEQIESLNQSLCDKDVHINNLDGHIKTLNEAVTERDAEITGLRNSKSWRLTRPLRIICDQFLRVKALCIFLSRTLRIGGGFYQTLLTTFNVLRSEGISGIRWRIKNVQSMQNLPAISLADRANVKRNDYKKWIQLYDTLDDATRERIKGKIAHMQDPPMISVIMPTYNPRPGWLAEAVESVRKQLYPHWELCIADDASTDSRIRALLEDFARTDRRIKVVLRQKNGHICAASNSALELATGEWVALLDHDDILAEHALYCVADTVMKHPEAGLVYSDEDKIDKNGERSSPYFKCDWNPDLFRSHNMISHLGVYRRLLVTKVGGFREGLEGSQDYDLALRCIECLDSTQIIHIPRVLYHWRIHEKSAASVANEKPYAQEAAIKAVREHLMRTGVSGDVEMTPFFQYRIHYVISEPHPLVSIIIPTHNGFHLLRKCVTSIIEKTTYDNYEVLIVDNGSSEEECLKYFEKINKNQRVRVVPDHQPFNYSKLNNNAVKLVSGEFVCLLNNDMEVITPDWISEMLGLAIQPEVGAVGARLWYPTGTLQHGGVITGILGVAGHSHKNLPQGELGYFGRGALTQSLSAVTAACLLVRRATYLEVGGLDEENLSIAFNDIDFCLRLCKAGYRNVWTPYAELYHHESATRGYENTPEKQARFVQEVTYMQQYWGDRLVNDPAYSPNLTLDREDFSLAWPPRVEPL